MKDNGRRIKKPSKFLAAVAYAGAFGYAAIFTIIDVALVQRNIIDGRPAYAAVLLVAWLLNFAVAFYGAGYAKRSHTEADRFKEGFFIILSCTELLTSIGAIVVASCGITLYDEILQDSFYPFLLWIVMSFCAHGSCYVQYERLSFMSCASSTRGISINDLHINF